MADSTNAPSLAQKITDNPAISGFWDNHGPIVRIALIVGLVIFVHLIVRIVRHISEWMINKSHAKKNPLGFVTQQPKFITITRLVVSTVTFTIYFLAIGVVLTQLFPAFDIKNYLATATVIGLAVGFGLQGFVQDVVIGVTLIFSDAFDVGDMVELSGIIGRVEKIGLRFTAITNFYNQQILVPNRNIGNVSRFPHGGVLAYADIQIPLRAPQEKILETINNVATGIWAQFGAIILKEPEPGQVQVADKGGWNFLRVQFKIWPGQNSLIETTFRQQMTNAMKAFDPNYADWMITVTYRAITAVRR